MKVRTIGASTEGQWIQTGFDQYLPLGYYRSDPGAKFSSANVQDALTNRIGTVLLFQNGDVSYTVIGSVPPSSAENAARDLG